MRNSDTLFGMNLLFASQNRHKKEELSALLSPHALTLPDDIGIDYEFDETGDTLIANALGKALHLYSLTGKPSVADDTGLFVDALSGEPGVKTARYGEAAAGRLLTSEERNELLLNAMKHVEGAARRASFVCAIALVLSPERVFVFQESLVGEIASRIDGIGGFGYDPVFYLPEERRNLAHLTADEKNSISHRGKAAAALKEMLMYLERGEDS